MQRPQIIRILTFLAVYLMSLLPAHALFIYDVSPGNLEEVMDSIDENYREALIEGIGTDSLRNYLNGLFTVGDLHPLCSSPDAQVDSFLDAAILFRWPEVLGAVGYGMSCLNFSTGESGYQLLEENEIVVPEVNDAVCLYAFASLCISGTQSIVRIIIVDKDIVNEGSDPNFTAPIPRFTNTGTSTDHSIQIGPNPFDTALALHFSLGKSTQVKFLLFNGYQATKRAVVLLDTKVPAGKSKLNVDLPSLASGWYYGVLEIDGLRQIIPLVKVGGGLP